MPQFSTQRPVRHAPERMFDLVADVERYPEFVPLCEELRVLKRTTDEAGREVLIAAMSVGYKSIRESFTSRVTLDRARRIIDVAYIDGPFRRLDNRWTFEPDGSGCRVSFAIDYEFRSMALRLLMGTMFDKAFRRFAESFERRADVVYGLSARRAG